MSELEHDLYLRLMKQIRNKRYQKNHKERFFLVELFSRVCDCYFLR